MRRDSADNFEQLQRSSAELKRSSAELQRMRSAPGSSGLESLEEGADKAVQLVLQIISDTASSGVASGLHQSLMESSPSFSLSRHPCASVAHVSR